MISRRRLLTGLAALSLLAPLSAQEQAQLTALLRKLVTHHPRGLAT